MNILKHEIALLDQQIDREAINLYNRAATIGTTSSLLDAGSIQSAANELARYIVRRDALKYALAHLESGDLS